MSLIVPGVCRYAVNASSQGRPIVNVLDMRIDTTGTGTDRVVAIEDQAEIILNAWSDHIMPRLTNEYNALSVSWVDLDEPDGSTGSTVIGGDETWPQFGSLTTPSLVSNTSVLVRKNIRRTRDTRNGRMYIAIIDEDSTASDTPNTLSGAQQTAWNAALASFLSSINQDGIITPPVYDSRLCVVHVTVYVEGPSGLPVPAEGVSNDVSTLTVDSRLATQRRRLRK